MSNLNGWEIITCLMLLEVTVLRWRITGGCHHLIMCARRCHKNDDRITLCVVCPVETENVCARGTRSASFCFHTFAQLAQSRHFQ